MVASIIFYIVVCWGSKVKANRLNKLITKPGFVLGVEVESLVEVSERRMLRKLLFSFFIFLLICYLNAANEEGHTPAFNFFNFILEGDRRPPEDAALGDRLYGLQYA